ncbi:7501_t:CDS:2, partial [Funneliformis caledonium]
STSSSYLNKFAKATAKRLLAIIIGKLVVADVIGLISVDLLNKTVEKGTQSDVGVSGDKLVPQPETVKRLKKILQPYEDQSSYHVIWQGVIYVDVSANFNELDKPEISEWERAMRAFKRASAVYRAKYKKPSVIIYDNVSRLVHKNPEILDILQDDAKDNADDQKYIAVFVSSEGSVPRRMESRSSWLHAKKPVMEISDLDKEESMEYLVKKHSIKEEDAKKLYDLVGGRIVDLKTVADDFLVGQKFEIIKQSILDEVEKKFGTARLLPNDPHYKVGKSIFSDLKESNELSFLAFKKYFDKIDELNEMLGSNIFAYHPAKNTVTFQSQSIKCYILEKGDMFLKKNKKS